MKLSRSESLVLREIVRSKDDGMSNKEIASALTRALSPQGLADALKTLQAKGLVYRDAAPSKKVKGAHASYKSTAASFEPAFVNDAAELMLSKETAVIRLHVAAAPRATANCLFPGATLMSRAKDPFSALSGDEDLGRKLRDVADRVASAWLDYRMKNYDPHSLKIVGEYEHALATYLGLFDCELRRWAPGAAREVVGGPHDFVDPLDVVENARDIDWPLKKYHLTMEELEQRHRRFPNADDALGRVSLEGMRKLKAIVYNERKKRIYEEYLKVLVPAKTLLLLDFGVSSASTRERLTSQMGAVDAIGEEGNTGGSETGPSA